VSRSILQFEMRDALDYYKQLQRRLPSTMYIVVFYL
jgi:hypothetical protein